MRRLILICLFGLSALPLASQAVAQGGGFVFDAPAESPPPTETKPDPAPKDTDAAPPSLDDFTFGGAPSAPTTDSVPGEEQLMWEEADTANTQEAFRRYLDAFPDGAYLAEARERLAELQAEADRRAGLVAACDRLAGDPEDPGLSDGAAGVALEEIDADAALWTCSRARAAAPDLPRLPYNLGRISEVQGQTNAALRGYRTAIRMAVEQSGAPHLPAAKGLLRLSEPRNPTERMLNTMLQLSIEGAGRGGAQQARIAELEAALAEARTSGAASADRLGALKGQLETLMAREMDLSAGLSQAASEVAQLQSQVAALTGENAALAERLDAALTEGEAAAALREELSDARNRIASLGEQLDAVLARVAEAEKELAEQ